MCLIRLFFISPAIAESTYVPSPFQTEDHPHESVEACLNPEVIEFEQIDPRFSLDKWFDQKETDTCYAHAVQFLVHYSWKEEQARNSDITKSPVLSLLDVIGRGCGGKFIRGGQAFMVLDRLRKEGELFVEQGGDPHIEKVMALCQVCSQSQPSCQQALSVFPILMLLRDEVTDIINTHEDPVYPLFLKSRRSSPVKLPAFNIHLFAKHGKDNTDILTEVANHLKHKTPVNLNFKIDTDSEDSHAVVITGSRKLCCGTENERECLSEWKIRNSFGQGSKEQGWLRADPLAAHTINITAIRRCTKGTHAGGGAAAVIQEGGGGAGAAEASGPDVECVPWIKTQLPAHFAVENRRLEDLQAMFSHSPHELASINERGENVAYHAASLARWEFVELIAKLKPGEMTIKNRYGQTPAHKVATFGNWKLLELIAQYSGEAMMIQDSLNQTPAHIAAKARQWHTLGIIKEYSPESMKIKDGYNKTPEDYLKENQ